MGLKVKHIKIKTVLALCAGVILAACHLTDNNGDNNNSNNNNGNNNNNNNNNNGGEPVLPGNAAYTREYWGEWIRMDTGDAWYITSSSISVNNSLLSKNVSLEKQSARVIIVTEGTRKYGLYASRTATGSFSGKIVSDTARTARANFGGVGGMQITIGNIKDAAQKASATSDEHGVITVESIIPGDTYQITVNEQTTTIIPHIDGEDIGTIAVTDGKNFKTTLRPKDPNMDMSRLYAARSSGISAVTYDFFLDIENTGTETWNASTYLLSFSNDLNFSGTLRQGTLGTALPGKKYSLPITLSCDPVTAPFVMEKVAMRITDPSVPDKVWDDTVSVKFNRAPVNFNVRSSRPVQGVIITPAARAYRFITTKSGDIYAASLAMPWTDEDYLVVFSGAEADTEAAYSLGINSDPPSDFRYFTNTWIYEPNNTENEAHTLDMHAAIMQGWIMAYLSMNDFDYYRVNIGPYIEYVE
jgi:hypothetical protein